MKTIEFKDVIFLGYNDKKYTMEVKKAIYGEVIKNPDFDDGTPNCEGSDDYEFTLSETISQNDIENVVRFKEIDWTKIKTIHFDKSCTVPRYKLGAFCADKGVKVIREAGKADLILYGKNFRNDITDSDSDYFVPMKDFLKRAATLKTYKVPKEMLDTITNSGCEFVILNEYGCNWFIPKKHQIYGNYITLEKPEEYDKMRNDPKYCDQEILLENMGGTVIDEFTYKRVCQMFDSEDRENHRVAMEIMANCNYGKSIVYLMNLMRKYYFGKMFYTKDRHQVSFKALREYLQYEPKPSPRTLNELITNVAERGLLTESNYKIILGMILESENQAMGKQEDDDYDADNWRPIQVDLSPKYKAMVIWDKKEESVTELEKAEAL